MIKLSKDAKYNRKRRRDGKKDFRSVHKEDGKIGVRVTRKALCVTINKDAYEKLTELAQKEGIERWKMLTRIIIYSIPCYSSHGDTPLKRYSWDNRLLKPQHRKVSYKGAKGTKQINYDITSTAWNKLECHKTASGKSKARIVQSIILHYTPTTPEKRAQVKQRDEDLKKKYG